MCSWLVNWTVPFLTTWRFDGSEPTRWPLGWADCLNRGIAFGPVWLVAPVVLLVFHLDSVSPVDVFHFLTLQNILRGNILRDRSKKTLVAVGKGNISSCKVIWGTIGVLFTFSKYWITKSHGQLLAPIKVSCITPSFQQGVIGQAKTQSNCPGSSTHLKYWTWEKLMGPIKDKRVF